MSSIHMLFVRMPYGRNRCEPPHFAFSILHSSFCISLSTGSKRVQYGLWYGFDLQNHSVLCGPVRVLRVRGGVRPLNQIWTLRSQGSHVSPEPRLWTLDLGPWTLDLGLWTFGL